MGTNLTSLGITAINSDKAGVARPATGPWDIPIPKQSLVRDRSARMNMWEQQTQRLRQLLPESLLTETCGNL